MKSCDFYDTYNVFQSISCQTFCEPYSRPMFGMILFCFFVFSTGSASPTSSLSSAWMKRGRANPTWASSVMRTRYSELLNFGALSFLSISRMVNVVITVASDGLRSSFSSVALAREQEESDGEMCGEVQRGMRCRENPFES